MMHIHKKLENDVYMNASFWDFADLLKQQCVKKHAGVALWMSSSNFLAWHYI